MCMMYIVTLSVIKRHAQTLHKVELVANKVINQGKLKQKKNTDLRIPPNYTHEV